MYISRSESRSRHRAIEKQLESTEKILSHRDAREELGEERTRNLTEILGRLTVANIRDGNMKFPDTAEENAIMITAINRDETLNFTEQSFIQTPKQKENSLELINRFSPIDAAAKNTYENFSMSLQSQLASLGSKEIKFGDSAGAKTVANSGWFPTRALRESLKDIPDNALVQLIGRPAIILTMDILEERQLEGFSHELTHAAQKENSPLNVYAARTEFDINELSSELEAYHVGAYIFARRSGKSLDYLMSSKQEFGENTQSTIEALRRNAFGLTGNQYTATADMVDFFTRNNIPISHGEGFPQILGESNDQEG